MANIKIYASLVFFLFLGKGFSQKTDSLWNVWENTSIEDTIRLKAADAICTKYRLIESRPDSAITLINKMLHINKDKKFEANCYNYLGIAYSSLGIIESGLLNYNKSLVLKKEIGSKSSIGGTLNNIAILYKDFGHFDSAIEFAKKSLAIRSENNETKKAIFPLNTLGTIYLKNENYTEALIYFDSCYVLAKSVNHTLSIITSLINIGATENYLKKYDSSDVHFKKAIELSKKHNSNHTLFKAYNNYSYLLMSKKDFLNAKFYAEKSLNYAIKQQNIKLQLDSYKQLYKIHKGIKNHKISLDYYEQFTSLNSSIMTNQNRKNLIKSQYKFEYNLKQVADSLSHKNEIQLFIKDRKIDAAEKNTLWISLLLLLIITASILLFLKQKHQVLKAEIERNKKELETFTLQLIEKNKSQQGLKEKLANIIKKTNYNENDINLSELIDSKILTDEDWLSFKTKFNNVYPLFFVQMKKKIDKLTMEEERLILMNKLKLKNSEIAQLIGISPESIIKSKYRLKKKLNISKEISLVDYVEL